MLTFALASLAPSAYTPLHGSYAHYLRFRYISLIVTRYRSRFPGHPALQRVQDEQPKDFQERNLKVL